MAKIDDGALCSEHCTVGCRLFINSYYIHFDGIQYKAFLCGGNELAVVTHLAPTLDTRLQFSHDLKRGFYSLQWRPFSMPDNNNADFLHNKALKLLP